MTDNPVGPDPAPAEAVQAALKRTVEINLAREKALTDLGIAQGVDAFHSNGIIFSKSGNGTPFSNGLIFSKTGSVSLEDIATIDGQEVMQGVIAADEATFNQFTARLMAIREAKSATKRVIGDH